MSEIIAENPDPCDEHVHVEVPLNTAEVITWQLAVQLVRRHPGQLWLLRTYPMDGNYDCLSVRRIGQVIQSPSVAFNRNGTHVNVSWFGKPAINPYPESVLMSWGDPLAAKDPHDWLLKLERIAGLETPLSGLSASTPSSLVLRWISQFLTIHLQSRQRWTAWTVEDPDRDGLTSFQSVPGAAAWLRAKDDPLRHFHVWFVGHEKGQEATYALSSDGDLWNADGSHYQLRDEHADGGSVLDLLTRTARRAFP